MPSNYVPYIACGAVVLFGIILILLGKAGKSEEDGFGAAFAGIVGWIFVVVGVVVGAVFLLVKDWLF